MLSIIIPAHNEADRIEPTLESYGKFFELKTKKDRKEKFEIIVVNNASKDNTLDIIKKFSKKYKQIRYIDLEQGGKGYAILEGFKSSNGDLVGFVDADMSTSPEAFYDIYKNINNFDGIIGSRWLKNSKTERSLGKYIRSKGFNFLVRLLFFFPYKDTQCGAKIFVKDKIIGFVNNIKSIKWAFDVNLLYFCRKNKLKIKEHPTEWSDKEGSKISFRVPLQMAAGVIRLRLLYSPFKFIVGIYDKSPEILKIHH
ncbi:MAG TPA: glycosyltransferase [Candidatus Nanoarchaeia archaeon]|nr:glycosyltransferase [Candidatus Nanoarchaeia archaeon]